ncbi:ScbR family autoregulator-binding transcription factor [Rhodococcus sp. NPDC058639]|uniref:ScbR family autoregulator-binding transcription factor n=1 Tax=Rhodococcus sp. NPDC058639 TaxID=3346570 RepID=UPI003651321B
MGRQVRAEVTREAVLRGAAEVFVREGYANASLNEIIEEAGVTKGALYFHFGSKEELARGVIDAGYTRMAAETAGKTDRRAPALEAAIELSVLNVDLAETDPVVRAMFRLLVEIGDYRGAEERPFDMWLEELKELTRRAGDEGDLAEHVDTDAFALLLMEAGIGARTVGAAMSGTKHLTERIEAMWSLLLPSVVPPSKLEYFRQFAARRLRLQS